MGMPAKVLTHENKIARFHQGLRNVDTLWRGKIADKVLETRDKYVPFCSACAIKQLNVQIEEIRKKVEKRSIEGSNDPINLDVNVNFKACTDSLKFEGEAPMQEKRISADGKVAMVKVGKYKTYVCTNGHKLSVEVYDYEKDKWDGKSEPDKGLEEENKGDSQK